MDCPRCDGGNLVVQDHLGIEVDRCTRCQGMWLDHHEMDLLEDTVLDKDNLKGSMMYAERPSDISCPKCQDLMTTFNYRPYDLPIDSLNQVPRPKQQHLMTTVTDRAYALPIDFCNRGHGFWLDPGEEKRVLELMEKRIRDLKRTASAEGEWAGFLKGLASKKAPGSKSVFGKVKGWFTGKR